MFIKRTKHFIGDFEGFFKGTKDFFDLQFVLSFLEKSPIMCFASIQKITSQTIIISVALIFLCTMRPFALNISFYRCSSS
jgi:hypothetical protein